MARRKVRTNSGQPHCIAHTQVHVVRGVNLGGWLVLEVCL